MSAANSRGQAEAAAAGLRRSRRYWVSGFITHGEH
jgi:hypothetical protein